MSQLVEIQKSQLVLALDATPFTHLEEWEQTNLVAGLIKKVALYTMYAVDPPSFRSYPPAFGTKQGN